MNLIKVTLAFVDEPGVMRMPTPPNVPVSGLSLRGEESHVGVWPKDFLITDEQDAMMTGRIDLIEYLGSETVLTVRAEAGEFMVKAGDRQTFRLNDVLNVKVPPENISLFSPRDSGTDRNLVRNH